MGSQTAIFLPFACVFAGNAGVEIAPTPEEVAGFNAYIESYKAGLAIEHSAVQNKK